MSELAALLSDEDDIAELLSDDDDIAELLSEEADELSAEFEEPEHPVMAAATTRAIIEVVRKRMYIS